MQDTDGQRVAIVTGGAIRVGEGSADGSLRRDITSSYTPLVAAREQGPSRRDRRFLGAPDSRHRPKMGSNSSLSMSMS